MFWNAFIGALGMLAHWEAYVLGLLYVVVLVIPLLLLEAVFHRKDIPGIIPYSYRPVHFLLRPIHLLFRPIHCLLQGVAVFCFITVLSPLLLGFGNEAWWLLPVEISVASTRLALGIVLLLTLIGWIFSLIPIVGWLDSWRTLIMGGLCLVLLYKFLDRVEPGLALEISDPLPGLSLTIGFFAIGGMMQLFANVLNMILLRNQLGHRSVDLLDSAATINAEVLGFFPLFMYAAYLRS